MQSKSEWTVPKSKSFSFLGPPFRNRKSALLRMKALDKRQEARRARVRRVQERARDKKVQASSNLLKDVLQLLQMDVIFASLSMDKDALSHPFKQVTVVRRGIIFVGRGAVSEITACKLVPRFDNPYQQPSAQNLIWKLRTKTSSTRTTLQKV